MRSSDGRAASAAEKVILDGQNLTLEQVVRVAREGVAAEIAPEALARVEESRRLVEAFLRGGKAVYGVTTGFGKFSDVMISPEETEYLQRNLIVSHACGVGEPLDPEIVRAVMLLRANALCKGFSGIRRDTLETLVAMLNRGVHPIIPEKGSLGASGDLAPLAHMVLVLIGEGEAWYEGERLPGGEAMRRSGIPPVTLQAKEGLALINGTQVMTAIGALAAADALSLARSADVVAALTAQAVRGIPKAFDPRVNAVRPHPGQAQSARNLLRLLAGSRLVTAPGELRVQDPYTIRCIPQVHGASRGVIDHVREVLERELNSATDNPLLFPESGEAGSPDSGEVISGGNFHGQPVALALDYLGMALAELANIAERRVERLVNPQLSGLPAFLTRYGGLHSGFMIAQYTAAALVSENKILASPASVDSIPSSANQEDHVSMGTISARKARAILENARNVLAIELLCASQAAEFLGPDGLGSGTTAAYRLLRREVPPLDEDRVLAPDIARAASLIASGDLLAAVRAEIGELE